MEEIKGRLEEIGKKLEELGREFEEKKQKWEYIRKKSKEGKERAERLGKKLEEKREEINNVGKKLEEVEKRLNKLEEKKEQEKKTKKKEEEPYLQYVPQKTSFFLEVNLAETPNCAGLYTQGVATCLCVIVTNPQKDHFILCHADSSTDLSDTELGLPAWIGAVGKNGESKVEIYMCCGDAGGERRKCCVEGKNIFDNRFSTTNKHSKHYKSRRGIDFRKGI